MSAENIIASLRTLPPDEQLDKIKHLSTTESVETKKKILAIAETINPPWFKNALLQALKEEAYQVDPKVLTSNDSEDVYNVREIRSAAVAESVGHIIHELQPIIGSLELAATKELPDYKSSNTRNEVERLQDLLDLFAAWRKAEQKPNYKLLDLNKVINEEVDRANAKNNGVEFDVSLPSDLSFELDNSLIRTVISNGLRNAVESSNQVVGRDVAPIVIRSDCTDRNFWLSIIDNGVGLSSSESTLVKNRFTTKPGNSGFGLAIVDKSVESMQGTWKLQNSATNGAVFYIEIPRRDN
ncbi:ATP-binding protein [Vibrio parahaemolyticus]|uniref:sensor histidine kinase n=1 Tax=Vibrio TaxID=662 RepID=UPI000680EA40|nr:MULTISPECIES: HAMP domain-containing sensor histidine kinase [Vibrio]EJE8512670.1 HAMP domain-containing histidine kinase [Vibrio parahaemolyticus]EJE8773998.1 HAMP domain-containing histidine kinase [Vibrio parahaemolyticus]MDW3122127.1 HAMP domain-containing sensor histidine kinase [Vibrio sp. 1974]